MKKDNGQLGAVDQQPKIIWDNFFTGVDPSDVLGNLGFSIFGPTEKRNRSQNTQYMSGVYSGSVTPFRNFGILQPAPQKANATNMSAITDTPRRITVSNSATGNAYMITSGGKIHNVTGIYFDSVANTGIWPHTITGASNGYDCMIANVNGSDVLLYTFDKGSGSTRYVGVYDLNTTFTETYALTDISSSVSGTMPWLPMAHGEDLNYYIGNGNVLEKIAYNSAMAVTQSVLQLPKNMVIASIRPWRGYLMISAYEKQALSLTYAKGRCAVYMWKYGAESGNNFTDVIYISDNKIGELAILDNVLYAFTGDNDGYSKLRVLNSNILTGGSSFKTVCAFDQGIPNHNSTDVYRNMLIWGGSASTGRVWTYGSVDGTVPVSLQQIDTGATGFVKVLTTVAGYHYHIAGASLFSKALGNYTNGAIWQSTPVNIPHRSNLLRVTVHFIQTTTAGGSDRSLATVYYSSNNGATMTSLGTIDYNIDGAKDHKTFNFIADQYNSPNDVDVFCMKIAFNGSAATTAVQVKSVEVTYQNTINW